MIKYTCVSKKSKRVYTFLSLREKYTELDLSIDKYRLASLDLGELSNIKFTSEKEIEEFLEESYEIKIKEQK